MGYVVVFFFILFVGFIFFFSNPMISSFVFFFFFLAGNRVGSEGAIHLAECLRVNSTLKKLDLQCLFFSFSKQHKKVKKKQKKITLSFLSQQIGLITEEQD